MYEQQHKRLEQNKTPQLTTAAVEEVLGVSAAGAHPFRTSKDQLCLAAERNLSGGILSSELFTVSQHSDTRATSDCALTREAKLVVWGEDLYDVGEESTRPPRVRGCRPSVNPVNSRGSVLSFWYETLCLSWDARHHYNRQLYQVHVDSANCSLLSGSAHNLM